MALYLLLAPGPSRRRRPSPAAARTASACASGAGMPQSTAVGEQTFDAQVGLRAEIDPGVVDGRDGDLDRVAGLIA